MPVGPISQDMNISRYGQARYCYCKYSHEPILQLQTQYQYRDRLHEWHQLACQVGANKVWEHVFGTCQGSTYNPWSANYWFTANYLRYWTSCANILQYFEILSRLAKTRYTATVLVLWLRYGKILYCYLGWDIPLQLYCTASGDIGSTQYCTAIYLLVCCPTTSPICW